MHNVCVFTVRTIIYFFSCCDYVAMKLFFSSVYSGARVPQLKLMLHPILSIHLFYISIFNF